MLSHCSRWLRGSRQPKVVVLHDDCYCVGDDDEDGNDGGGDAGDCDYGHDHVHCAHWPPVAGRSQWACVAPHSRNIVPWQQHWRSRNPS